MGLACWPSWWGGREPRQAVREDSCHVPCPARLAALAAGEAGAELCLPTEGIQSLSAQSCRKATVASQQRACPSARHGNPLAAHAQQGPGGLAKPAELGERRRWGQAEEQVRPVLQQSGDLRGLGLDGSRALLHGNGFGTCPVTILGEGLQGKA